MTYYSRDSQAGLIRTSIEEIASQECGLAETIQKATELIDNGEIALANDVAYELSGYIFRQLADDEGVTLHEVETLRQERYFNIDTSGYYYGRYDRCHLVGKRALNYALSAYNAFQGGPRHTLDKRYGIERSERQRTLEAASSIT